MSNNDNKKWNNFIHAPLLIAITVSSLAVTGYSAYQKDGLYSYYGYDYKTPLLTLAMRGLADGATPLYVTEDYIEMVQSQDADHYIELARSGAGNTNGNAPDNGNASAGSASSKAGEDNYSDSKDGKGNDSKGSGNEGPGQGSSSAAEQGSSTASNGNNKDSGTGSSKNSGSGTSSSAVESASSSADNSAEGSSASSTGSSESQTEAEKFPYMTTTGEAGADYFADALFIGDSRTVGLSEYCAELDEQATFYGKVSLSIYEANNKAFIKTSGGKLTLEKALEGKDFKKVYIMVGINEIGYGSTDGWIGNYEEVIEKVQAACPDAIIYLQAIMHVTKEYDDTKAPDDSINGVINTRSEALKELADNRKVFYLDINEALDDENGNLQADISFDGVHLKASAYTLWYEFLRTHVAVVEQE